MNYLGDFLFTRLLNLYTESHVYLAFLSRFFGLLVFFFILLFLWVLYILLSKFFCILFVFYYFFLFSFSFFTLFTWLFHFTFLMSIIYTSFQVFLYTFCVLLLFPFLLFILYIIYLTLRVLTLPSTPQREYSTARSCGPTINFAQLRPQAVLCLKNFLQLLAVLSSLAGTSSMY